MTSYKTLSRVVSRVLFASEVSLCVRICAPHFGLSGIRLITS